MMSTSGVRWARKSSSVSTLRQDGSKPDCRSPSTMRSGVGGAVFDEQHPESCDRRCLGCDGPRHGCSSDRWPTRDAGWVMKRGFTRAGMSVGAAMARPLFTIAQRAARA